MTSEFEQWLFQESKKSAGQVMARIRNIAIHEHFGDFKFLGDGLAELRWKNGRRVYFSLIEDGTLLLLGGYKNEQKKDIKKAKASLGLYEANQA